MLCASFCYLATDRRFNVLRPVLAQEPLNPAAGPGKMRALFPLRYSRTAAMSIKSDKWIRRMALEHGMIEPFVERQVRAEGAQPLISYGVSSYGYDVRCAVEFFRIPRDVLTICLGKSTYARCGIIVNVTPLEPEWEGHVTLEFSNTTTLPAKIYANEGVAQMIFFESDEICETSYKDRGGKYQGQKGVTLPKA